MQVREALNGLGLVKGEDGVQVVGEPAVPRLPLPVLSLVGTEILDLEGLAVGDIEEPLTRGMNCEAAKVAIDPAAADFLGYDCHRSGAPKEVRNEITLIR
jgi:hypothetical protein